MRRRLRFTAAFLLAWCGTAAAQNTSIAERLAAEVRSALPDATVTIPDPYGLDLTYEGQTRSVGIGSVHAACSQNGDVHLSGVNWG